MNNYKSTVLIMLYLLLSSNLFGLSDVDVEAGSKALLGVAFAIQLLILGGIVFFIKFLYKKFSNLKREIKMKEAYKYSVQFQYLKNGETRPEDIIQDEDLYFNENQYPFIPNVGDSVCYQIQGKQECRKVLSKHFTYWTNDKQLISVNIVVTDIDSDDMAKRLKE